MRTTTKSWAAWSTAILLASPASASIPIHPRLIARQSDLTGFDWSAITPTSDMQYHDCYGTFKCARLQVPLDWSTVANTTNSSTANAKTAAIAILTLPATVPPTSPLYSGPILINPGGPGGSGVATVMAAGAIMQGLADTPGVRHFDILGFDPRGVGFTTPAASCYASDFERTIDGLQQEGVPSVLKDLGLKAQWETRRGVTKLCEETAGAGEDSIFAHMSTAAVARDMLAIVEAADEWRVKSGGEGREEKARLQYVGFSYGSILGNTFASMFPGRVGRMVVDGIADAEDYVSGTWAKNINDVELSIDKFYQTCFAAGDKCPLRQRRDKSAKDIRRRVLNLLDTLSESPSSVPYLGRVSMVSSLVVSEAIRASLYDPLNKYQPLAQQLADAIAGNFTTLLSSPNLTLPSLPNTQLNNLCTQIPSGSPTSYTWADEASAGILCGDSQPPSSSKNTDRSKLSWARGVVNRLNAQSPTVGEPWSRIPLFCIDWPFFPKYAFHGPFGSPLPDPENKNNQRDVTPSAPLLILSTRIDHATPLANAAALSRLHKGSALVIQEGVGHCALLSTVSQCTFGIVREYLNTGTVPRNGTVCQPDCVPHIPWEECPGFTAVF